MSARVHGWSRMTFSYVTTLSYAMEFVIINTRTNTTTTSTSYFPLPTGYTGPSKDPSFTRTIELNVSTPTGPTGPWSTFLTNVTYPQRYTEYSSGYTWWGKVPTTTSDGASVCSWAPWYWSARQTETGTTANSTALSTAYATAMPGAFIAYTSLQPFGDDAAKADPDDPGGVTWLWDGPGSDEFANGVPAAYRAGAVPRLCTPTSLFPVPPGAETPTLVSVAPVGIFTTAAYLTLTSTVHHDGGGGGGGGGSEGPDGSRKYTAPANPAESSKGDQPGARSSEARRPAVLPSTADAIGGVVALIASQLAESSRPGRATRQTTPQDAAAAPTPATFAVGAVPLVASPYPPRLTSGAPGSSGVAIVAPGSHTLTPGVNIIPAATDEGGRLSTPVTVVIQTGGDGTVEAVVDGSTAALPPQAVPHGSADSVPDPAPVVTVGGLAVSRDASGGVLVEGQTLRPGDEKATLPGGEVVAVATDAAGGAVVVVNGATATLAGGGMLGVTVGGVVVSTGRGRDGGAVVVEGKTVGLGGSVTLSGGIVVEVYTATGGATQVIVAGSTATLPRQGAVTSNGGVIVGDKTLTPGETVTLGNGDVLAVWTRSNGVTEVVVGGSTSVLPSQRSRLGGLMWSGLGASGVSATTRRPTSTETSSSGSTASSQDGQGAGGAADGTKATSTSAGEAEQPHQGRTVWLMLVTTVVLMVEMG
ncbi:hypothetical protein B0J12DRAFT_732249 [Macrophomina phaseolina]|uniref:Uncharacterized protein n=1 Tax=Macrophomina phaseolina TaxID=35725 RepID=A0ABQ8FWD5_9PEZI|nr:hypothetical protein B0J12DRAFT_732249 [Macrophomina phaseolina]